MPVPTPRHRRAALLLLVAANATACGGLGAPRAAPSPLDNQTWVAALLSRSTSQMLSGEATVVPTEERDGWRVTVEVEGRGSAVAAYGWRVMTGACGTSGLVVGSPVDYPVIQLEANGRAVVATEFEPGELRAGLHSVRIYANPGATGAVVACGELRER